MTQRKYFDEDKFLQELLKHYSENKPANIVRSEFERQNQTILVKPLPIYLIKEIFVIPKELIKSKKFNQYTPDWKENMLGEAQLDLMLALYNQKYKPEKHKSCFNYYTSIATYAFIRIIIKEKKYHDTKIKMKEILDNCGYTEAEFTSMKDDNYNE